MTRIGVGRITCGNRPLRDLRIPNAAVYTEHLDSEQRGPAYGRNLCLKRLMDAGCDVMFLFDDDCYPLMDGWAEYFIHWSAQMSIEYFGLPEVFKGHPKAINREVVYWDRIIGCFNFQTREFMEKVGYYNSEYKGYGWEDSGRNHRAARSGLVGNNCGMFPSLLRAPAYIFSEDVYGTVAVQNLTPEEKQVGIDRNRAINRLEGASSRLYYGPNE